ncbi:MAG: hypothetical protein IPK07_35705 [Deltaproteobacteria bacterium]|nr:hypothetical protein [Deltaproteobacteria bacterium]
MPATPSPRRLRTALACLAVVVAAPLSLEVGLRLEAALEDAEIDRGLNAMRRRPPPPKGAVVSLADIVQMTANPRLVYELIPGLDVKFIAPLTTNSAGFRGAEIAGAKAARTVRILGLGDSVMFGWAVRDGEDFVSALARELARRHPEVAWEGINTAVPGYNAVMEVETLVAKGLRFDPDLVLLNLVGNDMDLPNFIRRRAEPLSLAKSFLAERIGAMRAARARGAAAERPDGMVAAPWVAGGFARNPGDVPPEYRDMVGPEAVKKALVELRDVTRARGIALLWVGHPELDDGARRQARRWRIETVSTRRTLERYAREHGITEVAGPPLSISKRDPHPTPLGHRLIAEAIADRMESSGLTQALIARALGASEPAGGAPLSARDEDDKVSAAAPAAPASTP